MPTPLRCVGTAQLSVKRPHTYVISTIHTWRYPMVRSCRCYRSRISDRDVSCERSKSRAKRHCALFIELAPTGHRAGHTKLIARQVPRGRSDGLASSHAVRQSHIHFFLFFPPFERMIIPPNPCALQRTRLSHHCCNPGVPWAASLSLGR